MQLLQISFQFNFFFKVEVVEISLNQEGSSTSRQLAIIDKNRDLYLRAIRHFGAERVVKLSKFTKQEIPIEISGSRRPVVKVLSSEVRGPGFNAILRLSVVKIADGC